ncbi:conserved unknown protein [Ectocarpus siliculosus]|uniref:Deoxyhypusine hydroxylase n=1 Tax=Ectocarpus siliculosus TaxID=2880 RepID=D7FWS7_ECTSI|nr:conserved unknown protein [Ectocarpus siliculosus]|eukprot:CBJ32165.1 conserved unknown protein [Ectocarpus siliculosus]
MGGEVQEKKEIPPLQQLRECLLDRGQPIAKRTHSAFFLRTLGSAEAVSAVGEALLVEEDSALLRHELAYILGQMQDEAACETLEKVLGNTSDDCMVRHEAAEALGAIGADSSVPALERFASDPAPEVSQTCQLALDLIAWRRKQGTSPYATATGGGGKADRGLDANPYLSVDPAPSCGEGSGGEGVGEGTEEMGKRVRDGDRTLFERYRAMFSLRNRGGEAAALELAAAFRGEDNALFKHEVAYVLGQMQHPATVPALGTVLADLAEHQMVRHEAAEALGAIGGNEAEGLLRTFMADDVVAVKESCEVALDTIDYWSNRG